MVQTLDLTQVNNPLAQTIRVTEPAGVTLTGVGLYFYSKPPADSPNIPVFVEIRPVTESGIPSPYTRYPGTVVSKNRSEVSAYTTWNASNIEKFDFPVPLYIPYSVEVAIVVYTNAAAGEWQIWSAELGQYVSGTTEKRITKQAAVGSFFESSNGTTWNPIQTRDIAFKAYKAKFRKNLSKATFLADHIPPEKLSPHPITNNPLFFTNGDSDVKVLHPAHGLQNNNFVKLTGLDSDVKYAGVLGSSILGKRRVKNVDPFGYTISMDSSADSSVRSGGNDIFAVGQMPIDQMKLIIPSSIPDEGRISANVTYKTHKHFGKNDTPYQTVTASLGEINREVRPPSSAVIMNRFQESDNSVTDASLKFDVFLSTNRVSTAPFVNADLAQVYAKHNLIDQSDSAAAFAGTNGYDSNGANGYNMIHTLPFVKESEPGLGSAMARHIIKPINLAVPATSIKVYVDAERPVDTSFEIWYRVANQSEDEFPIGDRNWIKFSTNSSTGNRSNYEDLAENDRTGFKEYFFSVFDLNNFDQLQVKIVMYSKTSYSVPKFKNLRILSTI